MIKRLCFTLCMLVLTLPVTAQTTAGGASQDSEDADLAPEKITVVSSRPGPGLWKISKGDHVLWIFGSYSPLPKNMQWRSHEVETILAQSQEYLMQPAATTELGFFKSVRLLPYMIGLKKNPDGKQLQDLLPADVYARWLLLKNKYIGLDDGVERYRPLFAANELLLKGLDHAGLASDRQIRLTIEKIAKKNNLKMTASTVTLAVDDPAAIIRDFKQSPIDDIACFTKTLDRLETDLGAMRVRAHAWAKGDLQAIAKLDYADRDDACKSALTNSSFLKGQPEFHSAEARMRTAWLAAAEKALANNRSTFAILQLRTILDPHGLVAALQAKGYTVEKPR